MAWVGSGNSFLSPFACQLWKGAGNSMCRRNSSLNLSVSVPNPLSLLGDLHLWVAVPAHPATWWAVMDSGAYLVNSSPGLASCRLLALRAPSDISGLWLEWICHTRWVSISPFPSTLEKQVLHLVLRIYWYWWVHPRYYFAYYTNTQMKANTWFWHLTSKILLISSCD